MNIDPLADAILRNLGGRPASREIVLGGYFVLRRYVDYRNTHDIDAWWRTRADADADAAIRGAMRDVAASASLRLTERHFGETASFELGDGQRKVFSFQIAVRSVQLEDASVSEWPPILVESLTDNVASKMNALVDRGSPRDLTDVYQVVSARLMTIGECWELWRRKNLGGDVNAAKRKVMLHVESLSLRRPLDGIIDVTQRENARNVRTWFRLELCRP